MFLSLNQSQVDLLIEEAYRSNPIEACALLFGKSSKDGFLVKNVVVAPNILSSTVEFKIDPQSVIVELEKAETDGLELVGFFHSHPAAPYPSAIDLKNMKLCINYGWLIFSLTEVKMAAYLLRNSAVEVLQLRIESK